MQWKTARIVNLFFSLSFGAGATGCRPTAPSHDIPAYPHQDTQIHVSYPNEDSARLLRRPLQSWALRQNVTLKMERYDAANETTSSADVWILAPADLPRWASAGLLTPLPDRYRARENPLAWNDLLPALREQLMLWEGKPYGLPLVGEAPICCYRSDLLHAPLHREALHKLFGRNLDGPVTWEQFVRLAEYFRDHGSAGQPAPSLPPLPSDDADLDRLFYTVAACYARRAVPADEEQHPNRENDLFAFHYDLKTGLPRLAAPGFVHALKLLQRMQACRPEGAVAHPQEAFRDGRAVLCLIDTPWLKAFQKSPALHDKIGVCPTPAGERYFDFVTGQEKPKPEGNRVPYLGGAGWLAVVSRASPHPDAAFDLLAELAGPKSSMQIFLSSDSFGGPTRADQLYRARWDAFDLDDKQRSRLRESMQETLRGSNLKNPVLCLRTPHQATHRAALVAGLRKALLKGEDAEKTLHEVVAAWRELDEKRGFEAHKADYRRSLGLLAK